MIIIKTLHHVEVKEMDR